MNSALVCSARIELARLSPADLKPAPLTTRATAQTWSRAFEPGSTGPDQGSNLARAGLESAHLTRGPANCGEGRYRTSYLSLAKRALCHLSYNP